ncbi:MAG TPA: choice-of-anchor tandem repeat GloVer-containing protein, partial [Verrucomicrobiae bacterium]|nr:choice-of-anchor tandem repeat GloVer-containing protein [Verrucomicrobiae bacterium]
MKLSATPVGLLCTAVSISMLSLQAQTYTNLHTFTAPTFDASTSALTNLDGTEPNGGLVLSSNVLYGTSWQAGAHGNGTLYSIQTDGSNLRILHTFSAPHVTSVTFTNPDGAKPQQTLSLQSNVLYGTTSQGGPGGYGTVFKVKTDGTGFT